MNKNGQIATDFRDGVKCLRELLCITMLVKRLAPTTKIAVLVALKDATIALMEDMISHRKTENMNQEKRTYLSYARPPFTTFVIWSNFHPSMDE